MKRPRFHLWHSVLTTTVLVGIEFAFVHAPLMIALAAILVLASVGAIITILAATEAIEEVRGSRMMYAMLTCVLLQFTVYFACQYRLLALVQPMAFPTLPNGPADYLLASIMAFVLNPLYLPATTVGKSLLIIETLGAVGLVLFVLQNMYQFRPRSLDKPEPT